MQTDLRRLIHCKQAVMTALARCPNSVTALYWSRDQDLGAENLIAAQAFHPVGSAPLWQANCQYEMRTSIFGGGGQCSEN